MKLLLAYFLAAVIIAAALTTAHGARRRSWPRIIIGASAASIALLFGYWIIL